MSVHVRFAPSPSGRLHIGNGRAMVFNWLFARRHGGRFTLRIDDTDQDRSSAESVAGIREDLTWLGLAWDDTFAQSDRFARYTEVCEGLRAKGRLYPCFETQEELDLKRKTQRARGLPPVYDRAALKVSEDERARRIAAGDKHHWRFLLHDVSTQWDDGIQGAKTFPAGAFSDPVVVREDGVPLYMLCSVIDDVDTDVTHVIRGEDHVANTVAQIQMWQAITDKPVAHFSHFPLIINADGTEMSKRLGTTLSVQRMRDEMGLEPMAINALIARLGTALPVQPVATLDDLAAVFDLSDVSRGPAKFDPQDLRMLNARILHQTPWSAVRDRVHAMGCAHADDVFWHAVRGNIDVLNDVKVWHDIVHGPDPVTAPRDADYLKEARDALPPAPWNDTTWMVWTTTLKTSTGRKGKDLFLPLRHALTGVDHGPDMKDLLPILGPVRVARRLK